MSSFARSPLVTRPLGAVVVALLFAAPAGAQHTAKDLSRARALDQQGARAYAEGRYADAIRYFEEAYRLGAPPVELWNIAKCHDRGDQPENAAVVLERYLALPDLPKSDREEAQQMLEGIKKRPSSVTITSSPDGASVTLDGKPVPGKTPVTTTASAGRHELTVTRPGYATWGSSFEARFGRAVIVDAPLRAEAPGQAQPTAPSAPALSPAAPSRSSDVALPPAPEEDASNLAVRALVGLAIPRYGEVSGDTAPTLGALVAYRIGGAGKARVGLGGLVDVAFQSWRSTGTDTAQPCGPLRAANDGVGITAYGVGTAAWRLVPQVDAGGLLGLGLGGLAADQLGGEVFAPTCSGGPGVRPSFVLGAHVDWRVAPKVRLSLFPILVHLQPGFDGTRETPRDASGLWTRFTFALGGGFDL